MKKTKILCTLGPASEKKEIISKIDEDTIQGLSDEELAIFSGCLLKIQDNLRKSGAVIPCESICTNNGERNDNK